MVGTLACRGPDAEGVWLDEHVGLGNRRLSVLDHAGGAQPMTVSGAERTVTVSTSGFIANYRPLREERVGRGQRCATESDTEVARAYLEWGEECLPRLEGAFACAIWDHEREQLLLARDQVSGKPVYYGETESGLVFGSESKATLAHPLITPMVDADGLREALAFVNTPISRCSATCTNCRRDPVYGFPATARGRGGTGSSKSSNTPTTSRPPRRRCARCWRKASNGSCAPMFRWARCCPAGWTPPP